ncbi:TPA: hypothetical protein N0F65_006426 [Lagenidium giganteum]|uniref:E3 ubiquitin protein ligase n=1 Tax=Lagenidium giganteum TaxID=4803 RepID=A0AAV2Z508_9STRA|nr:TPA: hypothetical protein N0F65_006426 [Lagenidium giganteum]
MELTTAQVNVLHKKFVELNEEISQSLRQQQEALQANATTTTSKKDVLKLARRALDWREDVSALAKYIDLQLQHSRALRAQEAQALLSTSVESRKLHEDASSKLRSLRSDLRLLQEFRLSYYHTKSQQDPAQSAAFLAVIETETKQLKELLDKSLKKEKSMSASATNSKETQETLVLQLFEARREIMSKLSEDILKDKKQLDAEVGVSESVISARAVAADATDKDVLVSLQELQEEIRERFGHKARAGAAASEANKLAAPLALQQPNGNGSSSSGGQATSASRSTALLDEVNFTMQKLKREVSELKNANAKLLLQNSQLEDEFAHIQTQYDEEKRAHVNEKKVTIPKIQKLEETVVTMAKSLEELKMNVELITNMYKAVSQTLSTHEDEENELKKERDEFAQLLSTEIKKIAALTKENERKDKLVMLAMAARHEMMEQAKYHQKISKDLQESKTFYAHKAKEAEDELAVLKHQIDGAYARLEATDEALGQAKGTISKLHDEMSLCIQSAHVRELEMRNQYDKEMTTLQQRYDKLKRELMEIMSQNMNLDGRLRKMQEKLSRVGSAATEKES